MRIVIPGGTGQVGGVLRRALVVEGHDVVVLSRHHEELEPGVGHRIWDGRTLGAWAEVVDGADAVINLAGRSVSCRYTDENLRQMMDSRVESTRVVGQAIAAAARPPRVWLQMSTATIYADRRAGPGVEAHDEDTGVIGGDEPGVPLYWEYSTRIARHWEEAQQEADLPTTRRVALRSSMVMSPDRGGVFDVLLGLARAGLGGPVAGGDQYVSWIHDRDFVRTVLFLLERDDLSGPVNVASPHPLPQRDLMRDLRGAWGRRFGLPATKSMAAIGAWALRSDTELLLKSRRVVPGRLLDAGFVFEHPEWADASQELVRRVRGRRSPAVAPLPAEEAADLRRADFTYPQTGLTYAEPGRAVRTPPTDFHPLARTAVIGRGTSRFDEAVDALFRWGLQRRAGIAVHASDQVLVAGSVAVLHLGFGPVAVEAPVRVIDVIDEPRRRGFVYGTLPGHPERGEEAFVVELSDEDEVTLSITASSRAATPAARAAGPLGRALQSWMTDRYLRAV